MPTEPVPFCEACEHMKSGSGYSHVYFCDVCAEEANSTCNCGLMFCDEHAHPDDHGCDFDYDYAFGDT